MSPRRLVTSLLILAACSRADSDKPHPASESNTIHAEPLGGKGPDFSISRDGHRALLEVLRFRGVYPGPSEVPLKEASTLGTLEKYGNPERDTRKALGKLFAKFDQVGGHEAIIAIWNDDGDLEAEEVEAAVTTLRDEAARGVHALPPGLSFVVYGSGRRKALGGGTTHELYCFPLGKQPPAPHAAWQGELQAAAVGKLLVAASTRRNGGGGPA